MTIEEIKEVVDEVFKTDLNTKSRETSDIVPKFVYYTLARRYTKETFQSVANITGCTHSAVINGIKKLDNILDAYPNYKSHFIECESIVLENSTQEDTPYYLRLKQAFDEKVEIVGGKIHSPLKRRLILSITDELLKLSNESILDFKNYRLKPYLSMLKTEVIRDYTQVAGATRNHTMKI